MIFLVMLLVATSIALLVIGVGSLTSADQRAVQVRLAEIKDGGVSREAESRRRRVEKRKALQGFMENMGERFSKDSPRVRGIRTQLLHAGYRSPSAVTLYFGSRVVLAGGLGFLGLTLAGLLPLPPLLRGYLPITLALLGWMIPFILLKKKIKRRKRALQSGLADALDLMVVCVEAGLGLNQALIRVAEEMDRVNPEMSDELTLVTLEMRAGTPREEALHNLAHRTGLDDIRAWVAMLVQTDRFGTSMADSLRIHSDTMRTKRRQRAEEMAAKLTVKMLIPLVLFVFPAMFVVVLGPAFIIIAEVFQS
jgi:tight adherence protein C